MTFSISGRCGRTGQLGIAIASSSPSVAARCAYAEAGVGVGATQNITDPRLGPRGLALMRAGLPADRALHDLKRGAEHLEYRQIGLLDSAGRSACHSGAHSLGVYASAHGQGAVALGNLLANADVPHAMIAAFEDHTSEQLGDRLLAAMRSGLAAGGEAGPIRSAGMILVDKVPWPVADLRVDWHESDPLAALASLWRLWQPQMEDYVRRALDPAAAPSFNVAGDP